MHSERPVSAPNLGPLQQLVVRRLHDLGDATGPMSAREAAKKSRGLISYETLRVIARGDHSGRISDDTAQGLAFALDVPLSQVYEAASAPQPTSRWELPPRFDRLDQSQRRVVEAVAAAMLEAYERGQKDATN
jgi:hypothetical protein